MHTLVPAVITPGHARPAAASWPVKPLLAPLTRPRSAPCATPSPKPLLTRSRSTDAGATLSPRLARAIKQTAVPGPPRQQHHQLARRAIQLPRLQQGEGPSRAAPQAAGCGRRSIAIMPATRYAAKVSAHCTRLALAAVWSTCRRRAQPRARPRQSLGVRKWCRAGRAGPRHAHSHTQQQHKARAADRRPLEHVSGDLKNQTTNSFGKNIF